MARADKETIRLHNSIILLSCNKKVGKLKEELKKTSSEADKLRINNQIQAVCDEYSSKLK